MAGSTLTSWALLIWNTLSEQGYDPITVFEPAGADPKKLIDGQARYGMGEMYLLWKHAVELTQNQDFGIDVAKHWGPTTFHALGFAWLASSSLLDGLKRLTRYAQLVNNSLHVDLISANGRYVLTLNTTQHHVSAHAAGLDAGLSVVICMCRQLMGGAFVPVEVHMTRDFRAPGKLEAYASCEILYNQDVGAIVFDAVSADRRLLTGNPVLAQGNEHVAAEYLNRIQKDDVVGAVRIEIAKHLPTGRVSEEYIAQLLHINLRTLQRRLKEDATNFRTVLNDTRQDIAMDYILNSKLSLTEIGYLLGFSDQANFTRAFKRWTGKSPSAYRNQYLDAGFGDISILTTSDKALTL